MRDFYQYIESIVDPKRDPRKTDRERWDAESEPEDDDYDPTNNSDDQGAWSSTPDKDHTYSKQGLNAQYPLASSSGKMRGFQQGSAKDILRPKGDVFSDRLSGRELFDTLRGKLASGEKMTTKEIDFLIKLLDKQDQQLRR